MYFFGIVIIEKMFKCVRKNFVYIDKKIFEVMNVYFGRNVCIRWVCRKNELGGFKYYWVECVELLLIVLLWIVCGFIKVKIFVLFKMCCYWWKFLFCCWWFFVIRGFFFILMLFSNCIICWGIVFLLFKNNLFWCFIYFFGI